MPSLCIIKGKRSEIEFIHLVFSVRSSSSSAYCTNLVSKCYLGKSIKSLPVRVDEAKSPDARLPGAYQTVGPVIIYSLGGGGGKQGEI